MNREKIIIFGRGKFFREKYKSIIQRYEIEVIIDNSVQCAEIDCETGIQVFHPKELIKLPNYDIYCVSNAWFQMWNQLIEMGIEARRIKFGVSFLPYQPGIEKLAFADGEYLETNDKKLYYVSELIGKQQIVSEQDIKAILRQVAMIKHKDISLIKKLGLYPVSRVFGSERGQATDRYYIEKFLEDNSEYIRGSVLEVLNNNYTLKFGKEKVTESVISHVKGWGNNAILCNFETGEGVVEDQYDCIICTQTLQYIYDLKAAITNIYGMLKSKGTALITVPGIKPLCEYDNNNWGEYWSFTSNSLRKLCQEVCTDENIQIIQFGNVKVATAYLYGCCLEELSEEDFAYNDLQVPFLICAIMKKG